MAKLSQLLTIEDLLESYDGLTTQDAFVTECFRSCVETTVDHVLAKLNRLLASKTKLSCRNVLTANFETMTKPEHWLNSRLFQALPNNQSLVLREKFEEMVELLKALMLKIKNVDPDFAGRFFEILKNRCDRQSVTDYVLWKADLPELTIDLLSEYQAEITANTLIMGALKYDRPPSEGEMQKVDLEKLQKKLIHKKDLPAWFKGECAKLRRYTHWEGEQHIELYMYQVQMNQIHEDMKRLMAPEQIVEQRTGLNSEVAMIYWQRLMALGFVDENCKLKPETSRQQAMYIVEPFSGVLGLKNKWKDFEDFWGIKNLAQEKWTFRQTGAMPARYQEIDSIFED